MPPADRDSEPRGLAGARRTWADERRRRADSAERLEELLTRSAPDAGASSSVSAPSRSAEAERGGSAGPLPWAPDPLRSDADAPTPRSGPPPAVRLWVPVVVSFLVQVVPAVVAFNRGPRALDSLLGVVFAVVGPLALIGARRFPGPVVAVAAAASLADLLFTPGSGAPYLALAFAIVSAMVRGARNWAIASVAAGWLLALVGAILLGIDWHPFRIIATSLGILIVMLIGEAIRTRAERLALFRSAMRKRREDAAQAERERIARELHDVLAHSLSLINVQAGMGLHLVDEHPEKAREALANIKSTSKTALDEVRGVLGFLRSEGSIPGSLTLDDAPTLFDSSTFTGEPAEPGSFPLGPRSPAPLAPQADLSRLPALVSSLSTSDLRIDLQNDLVDEPPPGIQLALFRIAQESLTNVARHAGATEARVVLERQGDDYVLRVSDNGRGARRGAGSVGADAAFDAPSDRSSGGGRGLLGMTERAELLGGRLEAGPLATGGFAVVATVPRTPRR